MQKDWRLKKYWIECFYDDRYIKTKTRTYGDNVYANFRGFNVPEDNIECESFTFISIYSLLAYEKKYYLQVYLDNQTYKIVDRQIGNNLFETDVK